MDTTYGRAVALAVPVFVLAIVLEFVIDRVRRTQYYHLADAINSLSCGIVSTGMRVFFGFLGLFVYEWLLWHAAPVHLPAGGWLTWVFAFVFYDFCYYWQHRLGHTVGLFWATHSVHHQSEEFNLTTALRQPGTGAFTNWIFYLPMALCGIPIGVFLVTGVIQLFYQFWPHTRLIGRLGILDRWIQTPSNHRVHHAQNDIYLDKNYVGVFLVWDHLFGTFQEERDEEPCIYGVRGQLKSWNPVWANLHYWWLMALDCRHAHSWRDKLRVWIAPPGWRASPRRPTTRTGISPATIRRETWRSVCTHPYSSWPSWPPTAISWLCWRSRATGGTRRISFSFSAASSAWAESWKTGASSCSWRRRGCLGLRLPFSAPVSGSEASATAA